MTNPPKLLCDNLGATHSIFNPIQHFQIKHILIDLHFVRDMVQSGILNVQYVNTKDQFADLLMKELSKTTRIEFLKNKISLVEGSSILQGCIRKVSPN